MRWAGRSWGDFSFSYMQNIIIIAHPNPPLFMANIFLLRSTQLGSTTTFFFFCFFLFGWDLLTPFCPLSPGSASPLCHTTNHESHRRREARYRLCCEGLCPALAFSSCGLYTFSLCSSSMSPLPSRCNLDLCWCWPLFIHCLLLTAWAINRCAWQQTRLGSRWRMWKWAWTLSVKSPSRKL